MAHDVVRPLIAGCGRLSFALDDTPTERYGPKVQGAGVHHNPTPGLAGGPFVYGHVWVVLRHDIELDSKELEALIARFGFRQSTVRQAAAWVTEKFARL